MWSDFRSVSTNCQYKCRGIRHSCCKYRGAMGAARGSTGTACRWQYRYRHNVVDTGGPKRVRSDFLFSPFAAAPYSGSLLTGLLPAHSLTLLLALSLRRQSFPDDHTHQLWLKKITLCYTKKQLSCCRIMLKLKNVGFLIFQCRINSLLTYI